MPKPIPFTPISAAAQEINASADTAPETGTITESISQEASISADATKEFSTTTDATFSQDASAASHCCS